MTYSTIIGVDISKDTFDAHGLDSETGEQQFVQSVPMTPHAIQMFIKDRCLGQDVLVVMEATGTYHLRLCEALVQMNVTCSVVNPYRVKKFADMKLIRTRTDKIAAFTLAFYGLDQDPSPYTPPTPVQQQIKMLTTAIRQLTKQRTQTSNALHAVSQLPNPEATVVQMYQQMLAYIDRTVKTLEHKRLQLTQSHEFALIRKRILSVVGIGTKTVSAIIGKFGTLETYTHYKQLVAAIGINPKPQQSGTSKNKTRGISKQGDATLRTLFYMAALSASRYNIACKKLYDRLIQKGKHRKTALIAVANKLVKQVFTMVKNETEFINGYEQIQAKKT